MAIVNITLKLYTAASLSSFHTVLQREALYWALLDTYYILGAISVDNMVRHVRTMRRVLLDTYYTLGATSACIIITSGSFSFSLTSLESLQIQQKRTSGAGFYS